MGQKHTVRVYSSQRDEVCDLIKTQGNYFVKTKFIREKYEEVAHIFMSVYQWYVQEAGNYTKKPEEAESGIWCFADLRNVDQLAGFKILTLDVPAEEAVFFDMLEWSDLLNFRYLGSQEESQKFNQKLRSQGITDNMDIMTTPYYPLLKKELQSSWRNLFRFCEEVRQGKSVPSGNVQAGLWQIKKEWVTSME